MQDTTLQALFANINDAKPVSQNLGLNETPTLALLKESLQVRLEALVLDGQMLLNYFHEQAYDTLLEQIEVQNHYWRFLANEMLLFLHWQMLAGE